MRSVSQLRRVRRGTRAAVTTMMMAAALLIPALAGADAVHYGYVWKRDADGRWEDKANWNCINPAGGNCNPAENKGYPNLAGDEAIFDGVNYTSVHTVTVTRTDIRVAKFFFGNGPGFTFQPINSGQIILNSGLPSAPAEIVTADQSSSRLELFVPFVNESPLVVTAGLGTEISFFTDIGPFDVGLTVQGAGLVDLNRPTTYTGPTIVLGKLSLTSSPGPATLSRELIVGNGGPGLAQLFVAFPNQLVPAANLTANFGWITVTGDNQISDLTLGKQSNVFVQRSASFVTRNVTMNDSAVISTDGARLVLTGDVTVGENPGGFSSGLFGGLDLSPGFRRFTVGSTLDIAGHVTGTGGLIKDGPGTLFFRDDSNGAADNTYFGDTRVAQGSVEVFATRVAVPGFLVIGQDNLAAQVVLHSPALAASTNVIVGPLGTLLSQVVSEDIQGLFIAPGGHVVQDGPSNSILTTASLTMTGGDVDIRRGTISVINVLSATSDSAQVALIHGAGSVMTPLIITADGPQAVDLRISARLVNALVFDDIFGKFTTRKDGPGVLELAAVNDWNDMSVTGGALRVGVAGAIPSTASLTLSNSPNPATLDVNNFNVTLAALSGGEGGSIPLGATTLTVDPGEIGPAFGGIGYAGTIAGTGKLVKRGTGGSLILSGSQPNAFTGLTSVEAGALVLQKPIQKGTIGGPVVITGGTLFTRTENQFADAVTVTLNAPGALELVGSVSETIASLAGSGDVRLSTGTLILGTGRSTVFSGTMTGATAPAGLPPEKYFRLIKVGLSTFTLTGAINLGDQAVVDQGTLTLDTQMNGRGQLVRNGAILAGTGRVAGANGAGALSATTGGVIAPGHGNPGILHADAADITGAFLVIQVTGTAVGTGYDQLDLANSLTLGAGARLLWQPAVTVPKGSAFVVVRIGGKAPVGGAFSGLPEGATFKSNGQTFGITYKGGDGNDVVVTALDGPAVGTTATNTATTTTRNTYFLSAGFTGPFFDEDVLIANPNDAPAPVTLTFTKDSGERIVDTRTVAAQSRLTVHVDQIPGLESTTASVEVRSDAPVPLAVERATFWDQTHYAGHGTTAVAQPAQEWFFAEGAESATAHTFLWLANPNDTPTDVTFTFVREKDVPVVTAFTLAAAAQVAVPASGFPDLADRTFGLAMHATQPILAERSLYVGTTPARASSGDTTPMGGTASMGVPAASTQWYFAEGATGDVFDTVFLFTNPQSSAAHVMLTYRLDGGVAITVPKTVPAGGRLTTNVEAEADPRLRNASFSTILTSDVPIVAERSMYWQGEGHTSAGATAPGTKWALAEGRSGGPLKFHTYLQLANPQTTAASVTVTYLREDGAPVDQAYTVPAMSRLTVDVDAVPGMNESTFGALVEVTNEVPIVVERSMYWNAKGVTFSGGTSAVAIRLP